MSSTKVAARTGREGHFRGSEVLMEVYAALHDGKYGGMDMDLTSETKIRSSLPLLIFSNFEPSTKMSGAMDVM